jgi:hypothetical protein
MRAFRWKVMTDQIEFNVPMRAIRKLPPPEVRLPFGKVVEASSSEMISYRKEVILILYRIPYYLLTRRIRYSAGANIYTAPFQVIVVMYEYRRLPGHHIVRVGVVDG